MGCQNNLRQIGLATINHHEARQRIVGSSFQYLLDQRGEFATWDVPDVALLQFLEEDALYRRFDLHGYTPNNFLLSEVEIYVYACPSESVEFVVNELDEDRCESIFGYRPDRPVALRNACYQQCAGTDFLNGAMSRDGAVARRRFAQIKDGLSHTLFWAEVSPSRLTVYGDYMQPWTDIMDGWIAAFPPNCERPATKDNGDSITTIGLAAASKHSGGVNVCWGDGGVSFISDDVDSWNPPQFDGSYSPIPAEEPRVWQALATRSGGETARLAER